MREENTIVAVSTPHGSGGLAVVRLSGPDALSILEKCWKGGAPDKFKSHTAHLGWVTDGEDREIDQVVATVFLSPKSYTGEDVIEISCHGSLWIQQALANRLIECGASAAGAGEFTRRAFMNGRLDLAQAEGVADMIAASSRAAARIAVSQLKGDFSNQLNTLRLRLIDLGSLLELELDFSEEDVEFANREQLINLTEELLGLVDRLAQSYRAGNAFKNGIPVAIAGIPNVGKSTLLNRLVGEDKAIVSEIPGTTRDIIEDTAEIGGILFRFFDTAGLRESDDRIESIGIDRAKKKIYEAYIILQLLDPSQPAQAQMEALRNLPASPEAKKITLLTKTDLGNSESDDEIRGNLPAEAMLKISAKKGDGLEELKGILKEMATSDFNPSNELVVTNARHYEALKSAREALQRMLEGLDAGISADFLAQDLREATHHLGSITGAVTSSDLLHTIFARYCIGK